MRIIKNEPLSKHTSYMTGGSAKLFLEPYTTQDLRESLIYLKNEKFFILGKGSNVLFSDNFFDGVVLSLKNLNRYALIDGSMLVSGAGCLLDDIVKFSISNNLGGIEDLSGIPGSVGGAVFMNAGAFDTEIKDVVDYVKTIDMSGKVTLLKKNEINFTYRSSGLDKKIVVEAGFFLRKGANMYRREEILSKRWSKQPIDYPSCGSVFKRPKGNFAGTLIEGCGLKGYRVGNAKVSEKHANFIINLGGATSLDIYNIIQHVKDKVYNETGIMLEEEVKLVNFDV
ncbi:UDP-N-acetylmuramate dehydrogenase [Deferribacterales bacterium Es71-Z0220]|jgi:UDP-N-acetylmuramate dehydrogenase|uniref:UDP-N-acetylmuramate dehydrogenase n=1 Tax=Deferrivibrio essentukiensis TaxID=2880922 RepID=UPI001F614C44|nr:UDP-N-acetylmuramate dehydrogenase [Deferrivibrio essentukiensis]MBZ4644237.1 UDP-N-acetylenolpyruvoylglucosamine reductase [Deferribacteraceae bacterium]MCB4203470.1 UDP-N-acetylmuramate dehydrogenase [Deferrivibrio essentukiensis]